MYYPSRSPYPTPTRQLVISPRSPPTESGFASGFSPPPLRDSSSSLRSGGFQTLPSNFGETAFFYYNFNSFDKEFLYSVLKSIKNGRVHTWKKYAIQSQGR